MPNDGRIRFRIPDACSIRESAPVSPETVADLRFEYNSLWDLYDLAERAEREQLWSRTYINALDRRKGNAVVAFTIRC